MGLLRGCVRFLRRSAGLGVPDRGPVREDKSDNHARYGHMFRALRKAGHPCEEALRLMVGGHENFELIGAVEHALLVQHGLEPHHYVVDVGCGSGRLAGALAGYLTGRYLGTDVVPALLDSARKLAGRPGWRFELAPGLSIPEADDAADVVCFFSVFTHLLHEDSYVYLRDARRAVRPGGKVVFSFLEYGCPRHWVPFQYAVASNCRDQPLTVFLSRDAIAAWARHLDLRVVAMHGGGELSVRLLAPVTLADGRVVEGDVSPGQSVCVLEKPGR